MTVRFRPWVIVALIALGVFLRTVWIGDMEYKEDEEINVAFLGKLGSSSYTPLAPVSQHAGIAHSSGFYYLIGLFLGGSRDPLVAGIVVAVINSVFLAAALWIARHHDVMRYVLALCATSIVMVVYSRKIWQADLFVPWIFFGLALLAVGLRVPPGFKRSGTLFLSSLCLVLAMHMYLGAGIAAFVVGTYLFVWFLATGRRQDAFSWAAGLVLGGLSFIPWMIAILKNVPGSHGPSALAAHLEWDQLRSLAGTALTLPTPNQFYDVYLKENARDLLSGQWGMLFRITRFFIHLAIGFGSAAFWLALISIIAGWRKALRDPLLAAGLCAVIINIPVVFMMRLGNYMHYWLGVVPLAFYLMAWTATETPHRRLVVPQRVLVMGLCMTSALASICFLALVHARQGLPGEYGWAYRALVENKASP